MSADDERNERRLGADLDLDAWEPQTPPADFAERVLGAVKDERKADATKAPASLPPPAAPPRTRRTGWGVGAGVAGVLALAAAIALKIGPSAPNAMMPAKGEAIAKDRIEVAVGGRAKAVLEPGATIKWDGDDVVQAHGDIFYRVEPGARFRVHTPAGDVEVKGTCFAIKVRGEGQSAEVDMQKRDVKSGAIGAALSALAFVAVYEGKVAVSHASEHADLSAGESAQVGAAGVAKSASLGDGQKAFDAKVAEGDLAAGSSTAAANQNLVAQVSEYRARLEAIAAQKSELEQKLKKTEEKLASTADGAAPRNRGEYDLTQEDWAELAKNGMLKFRLPCLRADGWSFPADRLNKLGLAPQDAQPIKEAYEKSYQRIWKEMRPMCMQALGASPEIIDKIGPDSCMHLVYDLASKEDQAATAEAHTQAAEVRAGLRPEPGPNDKQHVVLRMMLLLTGANKSFEGDLAKTFGPEEAHRLSQSDDMCNSNSRWGGGKKRQPPPQP